MPNASNNSNYPNGFAGNVTIRGMPILNAYPGQVYWVDSNGAQSGDGTFGRPYLTLQDGINHARANRGDRIMVKAGHAETVSATSVALNKAGVSIIGLGTGGKRPKFTYGAAAATMTVSAADITMHNLLHIANFADVAAAITLTTTSTDFAADNCEFRDTSSILNFLSCVVTGTTANAADGLSFTNNKVLGLGTTAATTPIVVNGTLSRLVITENYINLAALSNTSAVLAQATTKVVTNLDMRGNRVFRPSTDTATGGILVTTDATTNTGIISDNYVSHADVASAILVTAGCKYGMFNNLANGDADSSGFVLPAIGVN